MTPTERARELNLIADLLDGPGNRDVAARLRRHARYLTTITTPPAPATGNRCDCGRPIDQPDKGRRRRKCTTCAPRKIRKMAG